MRIQKLAEEYCKMFKEKKKGDGTDYICLKEDAPSELRDLVQNAHGNSFPDDFIYEQILICLCMIAEAEDEEELEEPSIEADIYNRDLLNWLSSSLTRHNYVDLAVRDYGHGLSIIDDIMAGQVQEKTDIYFNVLDSLKKIR